MDLRELERYRLEDAVKFHDQLNPRIWGPDERMLPEVRKKLLAIADDFRESLGIDVEVKDITISGSNAAYTYTPHSDIDLHLVADLPQADESDVYRELFDAKKYQYNDEHDFRIGGYDVELYVQDARKPHYSQGIYSIKDDQWISVPKRRRPEVNDISVESKYQDIGARIDAAIESGDLARMDAMARKIRDMRQTGLETTGEFGPENLAFKILRNNGTLNKLKHARLAAKDREMSLNERRKKKNSGRKRWGVFGGYYYPGFGYYGSGSGETAGGDGGGGDGGGESQKVEESRAVDLDLLLADFVTFCSTQLGLERAPRIKIKRDPQWSRVNNTFGRYVPEEHSLYLSVANRHPLDIMRTMAHELTHHRQAEVADMPDQAGNTGSRFENQANAMAGIIMRRWADLHPELFKAEIDESLRGKLGAAAAAACMAGAPGCATTDITATDALRGVQAVGRAAQATKPYGTASRSDVIRAGAEEELRQELKNILRRGTGTGDQSRVREADKSLPKLDDPIVNWDIPYSAIARPERLHQTRRFGQISHYESPGSSVAVISVPVSKERAFVSAMRGMEIPIKKSKVYEASGYIPTEKEKDDPRYKMALTVDVKPGQTGKEANKLGLKTDSQGRPQLLMKRLANLLEEIKLDEKCWDGYRQQGMKKKGDRMVPNCVKVAEDDVAEGHITPDTIHDLADRVGVAWDDDPSFMRMTQRLTGERHLDDMDQDQLRRVYDHIQSQELDLAEDSEDLFEVKMSPGELRRWAQSDEAEGIRAGFEAEMIFRDTTGGDSDDYQPDYSMDERARDIDEVVDFFRGGDQGISGGMANRLRESLYEAYLEWREEAIANEWEGQVDEQVRDWMENNVWGDDEMQDHYRKQAARQLGIKVADASPEQSEEIEQQARELFNDDVEKSIEDEDRNYEDARDDFRDRVADSDDFDQSDWFRNSYPYMSDVADAFGIDWTYWTGADTNSGNRTVEDIAQSLQDAIDMPVVGSENYHGTARRPGRWIIEPDGSLDPDEPDTERGLEIVSPPMPLPETLRKLQQVVDWANDDGDAYTNGSTGLHMGISIPHKGGAVDYVKLILFMGDQYVLDKFDRVANSYTASALGKLRDIQSQRRSSMTEAEAAQQTDKTAAAMDLMRKNLIELAEQLVRDGVGSSKYTSAHMKDDYIEFRSPGGDYLSLDSREDQALEDTLLRFARAMYIAGRPDVERREYSKKLYKLLSGFRSAETAKPGKDTRYRTSIETEGANDALELFAKYSSGRINREELKKQWAEQVLSKEAPPSSRGKAKEYEVVRDDTGQVIDTIEDWDPDSAMGTALVKWSGKGFDFSVREKTEAEPEKPASRRAEIAKKIKERPSIWRVTDTNTNKTILVAASSTQSAKFQAADSGGDHWRSLRANDPDSMLVEPATAQEVRQYMVQRVDNEKDREQVQQRVQGTDGLFPYRVRWTERRNGQEVEDSMSVQGQNADAAMAAVRHALEVQGRDIISIDAGPNPSPRYQRGRSQQDQAPDQREYQIYLRSSNFPVMGFRAANDQEALARLEQYRQDHPAINVGVRTGGATAATRNQLPQSGSSDQGEFTGRWQIRDALSGEVLHTISGVALPNQGDANRYAREWIERTGYGGAYEIVPEMR